jgi:CDP-paratose 2-epimerase
VGKRGRDDSRYLGGVHKDPQKMNKKVFITGGAGFIGVNIADFYLKQGDKIVIFDNLSRKGVKYNLEWLKTRGEIEFIKGDIRNYDEIKEAIRKHADMNYIFHEAAQVAVTFSVADPKEDFDINAAGTLNVLEAYRRYAPQASFVYASTNKVFGSLEDLKIKESDKRYDIDDERYGKGITEARELDFHSPYGCSKGSADQYVRDFGRIYGLNTIVFRQSCIYGTHQFGIEDQGWVAWFILRILLGRPLTIYGTGKQVRDLLFVEDLVEGYDAALKNIDKTKGQIYNMGGGFNNSISLLEFMAFLGEMLGKKVEYSFSDWRHGDQKVFIANTEKAKHDFDWESKTDYKKGIKKLYDWLRGEYGIRRRGVSRVIMSYKDKFYEKYASAHTENMYGKADLKMFESQFSIYDSYFGKFLPRDKDVHILDAGCGSGSLVYWLAKKGFRNAKGLDISEEEVNKAHNLGITEVGHGDLLKLQGCRYDIIFLRDVLEHFEKNEVLNLVSRLRDSLVPSGKLVVQTVNAENLLWGRLRHGDFTHDTAFTRESIHQLLLTGGFARTHAFPQRPVAHGAISLLRLGLWMVIEAFLHFYLLIETGSSRGIFTQNLIVEAE